MPLITCLAAVQMFEVYGGDHERRRQSKQMKASRVVRLGVISYKESLRI